VQCINRFDSWESEQNQWTATLTVLQHFQALLQCESSASAQGSDNCDNVTVKKRKIDANNKNYIVADAGMDLTFTDFILLLSIWDFVPLLLEWWCHKGVSSPLVTVSVF